MNVECKFYRPTQRNGFLQAHLDLYFPEMGVTFKDLSLWEKDGKRWLNMPARSYQDKTGNKKYAPYIVFDDAKYWGFQEAALKGIATFAAKGQSPSEPSVDDGIPF